MLIKAASWRKRLGRSPPTARVPSSRLGHSMLVSWWTKRGLGRFFARFLPFSPTTNFIPKFLHTHLIHFVSSALVMVRLAWSAGILATHGPIIRGFIATHPPTRPCVGHELRIFNEMHKEIKHRLNSGNACYYALQELLSSQLLSKNIKLKINKTVILPVILYECETWTLTLREEKSLQVFEIKF